ncbi:hypothetical protein A2617_00655, partial [Candidatus Daviesbacteria bacterium RIFOXYD1_FULL_41_10]
KPKGFTLIELLVTVAILTILALVGIPIFLNAQRSARDAKRQGDLAKIQSALENYRADVGVYPAALDTKIMSDKHIYLPQVPADPQTDNAPYCYLPKPAGCTSCTSYQLFAKLEGQGDGTGVCGEASNYNFATSPQGAVQLALVPTTNP